MGSTHATVLRRLLWSGETGVRRGGRGCGTLTAGWLVCSYSLSGSVRIAFLTIISFWPKNIQCTSTCIYIQKSYIIVRFLYALETPHWKALNLRHSDMCVIIGRLITPPPPLPPSPPPPPPPLTGAIWFGLRSVVAAERETWSTCSQQSGSTSGGRDTTTRQAAGGGFSYR